MWNRKNGMKQTLNNKISRVEDKRNKILLCDLVIFQTSWCYYLEFILNIRILNILILTHFKRMFHFYIPWKQQILDFWCFRGLEMEYCLN